jgi:flagellar basal-body rod modification protein FlgD
MAAIQSNPEILASLGAQSSSGQAKSSVDKATERFLTLLVTQMRNQDPLNPLDNAQVTTQLAQLNTVTGINQLNDTLAGMAASFSATQMLQGAALVGHPVMVAGSTTQLSSGRALFGVELAQPVDQLTVQIRDSAGNLVHSAQAGPQQAGIIAMDWDGALDGGGSAPDGSYRVTFTAVAAGKTVEAKPLSVETVQSVTTSADGLRVNLPLSGAVPLSGIRQIF